MGIFEGLLSDGFIGLPDLEIGASDADALRGMALEFFNRGSNGRYNGFRKGYVFSPYELPPRIWKKILSPMLREALELYLGSPPRVLQTSLIVAKPGTPRQAIHRDHSTGPRKCLCLAFSLTPRPLQTLVVPGSHQRHDRASTYRPDALVVASAGSRALVYDTYAVHAGSAAHHEDWARLFITIDGDHQDGTAEARMHEENNVDPSHICPWDRLREE
jgi:hypothetical protein